MKIELICTLVLLAACCSAAALAQPLDPASIGDDPVAVYSTQVTCVTALGEEEIWMPACSPLTARARSRKRVVIETAWVGPKRQHDAPYQRAELAGKLYLDVEECILTAYSRSEWVWKPDALRATLTALRERRVLVGTPAWVATAVRGPCWREVGTRTSATERVRILTCPDRPSGDAMVAGYVLGGMGGALAGAHIDAERAGGTTISVGADGLIIEVLSR